MAKAERNLRDRARKYWKALPTDRKWELGDMLVLGDIDRNDPDLYEVYGLPYPLPPGFLGYVDQERIHWEIMTA